MNPEGETDSPPSLPMPDGRTHSKSDSGPFRRVPDGPRDGCPRSQPTWGLGLTPKAPPSSAFPEAPTGTPAPPFPRSADRPIRVGVLVPFSKTEALLRQRLALGLRGEGQGRQAHQEHQAHGDAGVAHGFGVSGEDPAGQQSA